MPIDRGLVNRFLFELDAKIIPVLSAGATKLDGCQRLIAKYHTERDAWLNGKVEHVRGVTSFVNEICFAMQILGNQKVSKASYEHPLEGTGRTIDFLLSLDGSDTRSFYDVKTIQPESLNAWDRYTKFKESGRFTPHTELQLDEEGMGGEIAQGLFASRQKFLDYTRELEEKIRAIPKESRNCFRLVFCGDGVRWRRDHLEDFADFYFSGQYRRDDSLGLMQSHHMTEKGVVFDRSIQGFCYFERKVRGLKPTVFRCDIRGPRIPWENHQ